MNNKKKFIFNVSIALIAQLISLLCNVGISLIFPKFLSVREFAFWQLFAFYVGYVGLFHLGFNDGLYLKLGGKEFEEINKSLIKSEIATLFFIEFIIMIIISVIGILGNFEYERRFVIISTAIFLLVNNIWACLGYIFQAVDHTRWYSTAIILERIFFVFLFWGLVLLHQYDIRFLICIYIISKIISLLFCIWKARPIWKAKFVPFNQAFPYFKSALRSGVFLMLANLSGTLILGIGRYVMDVRWGIEMFGKFSFANSLTQFALVFICQFSMVMFPALRKESDVNNQLIYRKLKKWLTNVGPFLYLLYLPVYVLISWWLPQYQDSMKYMIILMPICLFDGKMNILFNTYFKVYNNEKKMFSINFFSVMCSTLFAIMGAYIWENEVLIIYGIVISIIIRSIIAEKEVDKILNVFSENECMVDVIFTITFWGIFQSNLFNITTCAVLYFGVILVGFGLIRILRRREKHDY